MTTYGYARVSTNGQDLASQEAELLAAGCTQVFAEKVSGARCDRAELAKVLRRLQTGDVLLVTRLDRLARSTRDLLNILADIAQRGAGFKSLHDSWADTTSKRVLTAAALLLDLEPGQAATRTDPPMTMFQGSSSAMRLVSEATATAMSDSV